MWNAEGKRGKKEVASPILRSICHPSLESSKGSDAARAGGVSLVERTAYEIREAPSKIAG